MQSSRNVAAAAKATETKVKQVTAKAPVAAKKKNLRKIGEKTVRSDNSPKQTLRKKRVKIAERGSEESWTSKRFSEEFPDCVGLGDGLAEEFKPLPKQERSPDNPKTQVRDPSSDSGKLMNRLSQHCSEVGDIAHSSRTYTLVPYHEEPLPEELAYNQLLCKRKQIHLKNDGNM